MDLFKAIFSVLRDETTTATIGKGYPYYECFERNKS